MKDNKNSELKRMGRIILIGQISCYFGLLILAIRHYTVSPVVSFSQVAVILLIGFLPSLLVRSYSTRNISYLLVFNALIIVSFIFTSMKEWALGGVFILGPVFALLFKDKHIYLFTSLASFILNISLAAFFLYEPSKQKEQIVIMLDLLTIYLILVFLIYFIVKDLVWSSMENMKYKQTIFSLSKSVEVKDPYTQGHSRRVASLGELIARKIPNVDEKAVYYSGLIHDVGKLSVPDSILLKNSSLTNEEYDIMKKHTTIGADICRSLEIPQEIMLGALHHHERWDGKGYPVALKGEQIPLIGRILCIVDSIDAMSSDRAYRNALDIGWIRLEVTKCSGLQFDPKIVQVVLDNWDEIEKYIIQKNLLAS